MDGPLMTLSEFEEEKKQSSNDPLRPSRLKANLGHSMYKYTYMCKYTQICTYLHIWIYRNMYEEYMNMNVYIKLMKNMNTNLNKEYTNVHEYIKRTCMYIVHRNIQFVGY